MYVVTPWPNVLYAFDLTKEGYPLRWKYRPDVSPNAIGISCCDTINRGAFYSDGKLFYNLLDGHTVAVDAKTGKDLWHFSTGHSLYASPVTYMLEGKQYVTIATESDVFTFGLFDGGKR